MVQNTSIMTLAGGLILVLISASCSSKADTRTTAAYDSPAGAMAACPSRTDAQGNVIYDDPTCPSRYRHPQGVSLQDATAHVRDARISLSQAGGMRTVDARPIDTRTSSR